MDLPALLQARLDERRARNARYSLRAFARDLALPHAALSQILLRRRPASVVVIRRTAARLRLSPPHIESLVAAEHERKLRLCLRSPRFQPSVRALSSRSGLTMDSVCLALQRMLAGGRLEMTTPTTWVLREDDQ
jgi:hypothetical protein